MRTHGENILGTGNRRDEGYELGGYLVCLKSIRGLLWLE